MPGGARVSPWLTPATRSGTVERPPDPGGRGTPRPDLSGVLLPAPRRGPGKMVAAGRRWSAHVTAGPAPLVHRGPARSAQPADSDFAPGASTGGVERGPSGSRRRAPTVVPAQPTAVHPTTPTDSLCAMIAEAGARRRPAQGEVLLAPRWHWRCGQPDASAWPQGAWAPTSVMMPHWRVAGKRTAAACATGLGGSGRLLAIHSSTGCRGSPGRGAACAGPLQQVAARLRGHYDRGGSMNRILASDNSGARIPPTLTWLPAWARASAWSSTRPSRRLGPRPLLPDAQDQPGPGAARGFADAVPRSACAGAAGATTGSAPSSSARAVSARRLRDRERNADAVEASPTRRAPRPDERSAEKSRTIRSTSGGTISRLARAASRLYCADPRAAGGRHPEFRGDAGGRQADRGVRRPRGRRRARSRPGASAAPCGTEPSRAAAHRLLCAPPARAGAGRQPASSSSRPARTERHRGRSSPCAARARSRPVEEAVVHVPRWAADPAHAGSARSRSPTSFTSSILGDYTRRQRLKFDGADAEEQVNREGGSD